jgi:hypothetical protein
MTVSRRSLHERAEEIARLWHSDGDFTWDDAHVGVLVRWFEAADPVVAALLDMKHQPFGMQSISNALDAVHAYEVTNRD